MADSPNFGYQCNETIPYVAVTTVINGVDYQIDSTWNLLHPPSGEAFLGGCLVGLQNITEGHEPNNRTRSRVLRSVMCMSNVCTRRTSVVSFNSQCLPLPTDNCPGYYGFAFPSGGTAHSTDRTKTHLHTFKQFPMSVPHCAYLYTTFSAGSATSGSAYRLRHTNLWETWRCQVPLIGVDDLPKGVWDQPQPE